MEICCFFPSVCDLIVFYWFPLNHKLKENAEILQYY